MATMSLADACKWYSEAKDTYESLGEVVRTTLENLLNSDKIDYLSVTSRPKSNASFTEKYERKGYSDPQKDMTDLAAIRVITYIEKDVGTVCELIEKTFAVHKDKSLNKSTELEVDRFGYRSVHFVCDLGKDRVRLPEFAVYKSLFFEIQVRTVLQHAWAEIEHDRNYKFAGVLPSTLRRRMYSIAGVLEIADREFNNIASELDIYVSEVAATTKKGELDLEVDSTTVREFLKNKLKNHKIDAPVRSDSIKNVIQELRDFGIDSIAQLDKILNKPLFDNVEKFLTKTTEVGVLRAAMMLHDIDKYFNNSWKKHWSGLPTSMLGLLAEKYGESEVEKILNKFGVKVLTEKRLAPLVSRKKAE
jgi:putative GTP pyrophosphokinase